MRLDAQTFGIIAVLVTAAAAACAFLGEKRRFIGVFLTIAAAILQTLALIFASGESNVFQAELRLSSKNTQRLQAELIQRADNISQLNRELAGKSDQLARYISGGDSFARIAVVPEGDAILFKARQSGRYPVYDLSIEVTRIVPAVFGEVAFGEAMWGGSAQRRVEIGRAELVELGIGREVLVGREQITGSERVEYSLLVHARNGWWQQNVTVFRTDSSWTIRLGRERKAVLD